MSLYVSFISLFFYRVFGPTVSFLLENVSKVDARQVSKDATKTKPQHKRKMKPTLLLLSLVAIALISGTEARLGIPSDGCTREKFYSFMLEADERRPAGSMSVLELLRSSAGACVLKTFLEVCDVCEGDYNCLQTRGAEVAPTVPECHQPPVRRLRNPRRLYMKSYANCQRCRAYNGYSPACNQFC